MDLSPTSEQLQLRDSLRSWLARNYPFSKRRTISQSPEGWSREVWRGLAVDLGICGPIGTAETMIVMEELGRALVIEPFLETAVIARNLLSGAADQAATVRAIEAGDTCLAVAWHEAEGRGRIGHVATRATRTSRGWSLTGNKSVVWAAPWADLLLVTARTSGETRDIHGVSLFILDPTTPGVELHSYQTIDGRRAGELSLNDVEVGEPARVGGRDIESTALLKVEVAGLAAVAAEALGVMQTIHTDTIRYLRQRRQFGRSLSEFQALQHRAVDLYQHIQLASSAVLLLTLRLDADVADLVRAADAVRHVVGRACRAVGQAAIQLHGGMGMTDDLALGHFVRRATVIEGELGAFSVPRGNRLHMP